MPIDFVSSNMCIKYLKIQSNQPSSIENLWATDGQMHTSFASSHFKLLVSEAGYILNEQIFLWNDFTQNRSQIFLILRDLFLVSRDDKNRFLDRYNKNYVFGSLYLSSNSRVLFSENNISVIYYDGKKSDMITNFNFKERSINDGFLLEAVERLSLFKINY